MTDVTGAAAPTAMPAAGLPDPAERGRLDIAERVVERVATIAAGEVPGVTRFGSTLEGMVGRQYPKAKAQVAGSQARVSLDIAVAWPSPLGHTAAAVRERVRTQLQSLLGLTVDIVDVTVASVTQAAPPSDRRVQ